MRICQKKIDFLTYLEKKFFRMNLKNLSFLSLIIILSSCANMPTRSNQITGSYTSGIKYEDYSISRLEVELEAITKRE
jgi:hypothetical protein